MSKVQDLYENLIEHTLITKDNADEVTAIAMDLLHEMNTSELPLDKHDLFRWERDRLLNRLSFRCDICNQLSVPVILLAFECNCKPDICIHCAERLLHLDKPSNSRSLYDIRCPVNPDHLVSDDYRWDPYRYNGYTPDSQIKEGMDRIIGGWRISFNINHETRFEDVIQCRDCGEYFPDLDRLWHHKM